MKLIWGETQGCHFTKPGFRFQVRGNLPVTKKINKTRVLRVAHMTWRKYKHLYFLFKSTQHVLLFSNIEIQGASVRGFSFVGKPCERKKFNQEFEFLLILRKIIIIILRKIIIIICVEAGSKRKAWRSLESEKHQNKELNAFKVMVERELNDYCGEVIISLIFFSCFETWKKDVLNSDYNFQAHTFMYHKLWKKFLKSCISPCS